MDSDPRQKLRRLCLAAVQQIAAECHTGPGGLPLKTQPTWPPGLSGLQERAWDGGPLVQLLGRQAAQILRRDGASSLSLASASASAGVALVGRRLEDLVSLAHARFYAYPPSQVPACWRQLYTDARILQFAGQWLSTVAATATAGPTAPTAPISRAPSAPDWDGLVQALDTALILAGGAGPPGRGRAWIHAALDALHQAWEEAGGDGGGDADTGNDADNVNDSDNDGRPHKRIRTDGWPRRRDGDWSAYPTFEQLLPQAGLPLPSPPPVRHPVARADGPLGFEGFQAYLDRARRRQTQQTHTREAAAAGLGDGGPLPLVIPGLMDHWPARRRCGGADDVASHPWNVPAYLRWRTLGGRRRVPVEVGRSYVDAGWTQAVVPMGEVLRALEGGAAATVYLAQHDLLAQIPGLRDDIVIPDACYTDTGDGPKNDDADADAPLLHAWLGPAGTITPLHTDPHHNLLAQVVGHKYVRLYGPEQTAALRPRGREAGVDMGNTSGLDVGVLEGWDEAEEGETKGKRFEAGDKESDDADRERARFRQIPYVDCILEAGDTLYIPRGWWHYVRGLSVSFSVSFWWN